MSELKDRIAQVVMMGIEGFTPSTEERALIEQGVGGVILFERNCHNPAQIADLIGELQEVARAKGLGISLIIAIDQEHGPVARIKEGITPLPSAWEMGSIGDSDLVRKGARINGRELAALGITMNLAPVADVLLHPGNSVIGKRSFGTDPLLVSEMVTATIQGLQREGVAACAKHFPGHGATATDSHEALPTLERSRDEMVGAELIPFQRAVQANVAAIMTGHLLCLALDPNLPATLSSSIIEDLLRKELGFEGALISDDLLMGALNRWGILEERGIKALKAGVDCLLVGKGSVQGFLDALKQGLETGKVTQERVEEAVFRIAKLKEEYPYKGKGDLKGLRREEDVAFSQELFQRVKDATGNPGDRAA